MERLKQEAAIIAVEQQAKYRAQLAKIASYAIPGSPENRAYHAQLDAINAMASEIRAKKAGR